MGEYVARGSDIMGTPRNRGQRILVGDQKGGGRGVFIFAYFRQIQRKSLHF
jgi:hypothetical protein